MSESYTNYFAEIYDDIMKQVPYKFWFEYLKDILNFYKCNPEDIVELAAGTGNMTTKLIKLPSVKNIKALDLSDAMIDKAADKFEILMNFSEIGKKYSSQRKNNNFYLKDLNEDRKIDLGFVQADMRDFNFEGHFDLVLSFFDSLNYLTTEGELLECFKNTAAVLKDNGLFIFDMNSIGRINTIEEKSFVIEGDSYECFWEDIVKAEENLWQVKLKICPDNEELPCFEEFHNERGYKIKTILRLLKNSGFKAVDVYNAFSFAEGKNNSDRLYFAAALDKKRLQNNEGQLKKLFYSVKNRIYYFLVSLKYLFKIS
jgi:SAM-dependent methyltransferase